MTLAEFGNLQLVRPLVIERSGKAWRCYFQGVLYAAKPGLCAVVVTIVGAGPNQERMREDFVQKIRGKCARVYDGMGAYTEFPVPASLTP